MNFMIQRIPVNDWPIFRKNAPDPEPVLRTRVEAAIAKTPKQCFIHVYWSMETFDSAFY